MTQSVSDKSVRTLQDKPLDNLSDKSLDITDWLGASKVISLSSLTN